jgi:hypothetical protein
MFIFQESNQCYCLTQLDVTGSTTNCDNAGAREVYVRTAEAQAASPAKTTLTSGTSYRLPSCGTTRSGTCPGIPYTSSPSWTGAACLAGAFFSN